MEVGEMSLYERAKVHPDFKVKYGFPGVMYHKESNAAFFGADSSNDFILGELMFSTLYNSGIHSIYTLWAKTRHHYKLS